MSLDVVRDEADKVQFDASMVKGLDPNRHYRWCRIDDKDLDMDRNLSQRMRDGYEVVKRTTESHELSDQTRVKQGLQLDNTIRWGRDMILVSCPKEHFEKRLAMERARTVRQTLGVTKAYKDAIRRVTGDPNLAYEEHRDPKDAYKTSRTSAEGEQMTEEQMKAAMKLAGNVTED
jgi:hypothetical protein